MHTSRPLLARVVDPATLQSAWKRVAGKRAAGGLDGGTVEEFAAQLDRNLEALRVELLKDRYAPQPLREIAIPKGPGRSGTRPIQLLTVRDKVAQTAVRSVMEPILDRTFLDCSYGYRPGRGPRRAIGRVTHYLTNLKHRWVATADIDDFFGSLDQDLLLDRLRPVLQDECLLRLIHLWLRTGTVDGRGRWRDVYSGVAQGGVLSPLLANFYLHPLDEYLVGQGRGLVRYADDFVLLEADRAAAESALADATAFLQDRLRLRLNPHPSPVASADDGFAFLGIRFEGLHRLVETAKMDAFAAKTERIASREDESRALRDLAEAAAGWRHYYGEVVAAGELERADGILTEALTRLVERGFRSGRWTRLEEAAAALEHIETVRRLQPEERRALITRIAREGKERSVQAPPTRTSPAPPRPTAPTRSLRAHPRESVAGTLRRVKRRYHMEAAQVTEIVLDAPGYFIGKAGGRVVVRRSGQIVHEMPVFRVSGITVASRGVSLSSDVVEQCATQDIPLLFLTGTGQVRAVLAPPESRSGRTSVLQLQAVTAGEPAYALACRFVEGKIRNQMSLLKYLHKYRKRTDADFAGAFPGHLAAMRDRLRELRALAYPGDLEAGRGLLFSVEGRAAQEYWALIRLALGDRVDFPGRQRQGATDLVNSLLNYGYAILQARVHLEVLRAGLTPQVSFLHAFQPQGTPTLVFDLMEEFRPHVVDRTVLALLNRREPLAVDGSGLLTPESRRRMLAQVQTRLATLVGFRRKEMKLAEIIHFQARLVVRHLQGERRYRPFLARW